jgi:hypothetical protein
VNRSIMQTAFLLLLLHAISAVAQEAGVSAKAWVDSSQYVVGDPILLHVQVIHPRTSAPKIAMGDSLGPFAVLRHGSPVVENDTTLSLAFLLSYYDSGTVAIPPVQVLDRSGSDSAATMAVTNPVPVTVRTVAVDTTKEFRDLKPPLAIPLSWTEIALYAGIILLAGALAFFGYRYWKKRKKAPQQVIASIPSRPADALAFEELGALKDRKLWEKGLVKEYYSELTEIVRRYFERRYAVNALEETTDEILGALRNVQVSEKTLSNVETLLVGADLVKFAKQLPGISEHTESMKIAYTIVEQTKLVSQPQRVTSAVPVTVSANVGN